MMPTRREFLAAAGAATAGLAGAGEQAAGRLGVVIHSHGIRRAHRPTADAPDIADPIAYLEYCAELGARGVQTALGVRDDAYLERLRARAGQLRTYVEGIVSLPKNADDVPRFRSELHSAKDAGATIVRTVCMGTRRYETFDSMEAFRAFAKRAWGSLALAEPVAAKAGVRLAVENHKDWRIEEFLAILKRLDSKHVGVCLDTGNSIALLEDPMEVVRAYAPWTHTTHLKDMAVADYADGFLLAEVPLGAGYLDLKEMVAVLDKANPGVPLNLEMITRDPLKVPVLTEKYWVTLGDVPGRRLAATLATVRAKAPQKVLPMIGKLPLADQLAAEAENVRKSFEYAKRAW
jgi:3-oxoisoapionate decarboxylase